MTPLLFFMGSWSLGANRRFLMAVPPLKCTCTPWLLHTFLKLSLSPLWYGTIMWCFWVVSVPGLFWLLLFFFFVGFLDFILILWIQQNTRRKQKNCYSSQHTNQFQLTPLPNTKINSLVCWNPSRQKGVSVKLFTRGCTQLEQDPQSLWSAQDT